MAAGEPSPTPRARVAQVFAATISTGIVAAMLIVASRYNYLLFHTAAELASIVAGSLLFIVAARMWNIFPNTYLMLLGVGFFWASIIDATHLMAYKGMGVFPDAGTNLPTQLWVFARYLQAAVVLVATLDLPRKRRRWWPLALVIGAITAIGLASIFEGWFPTAYIDGHGLTEFKKVSEYIISFMLVISIALLVSKRRHLDSYTFGWLLAAFTLSVMSELAFTFYVSVYGISNMVGHLFKIAAYSAVLLVTVRAMITLPVAALKTHARICARCKAIQEDDGTWTPVEKILSERGVSGLTHGVCPSCFRELYPEHRDLVDGG